MNSTNYHKGSKTKPIRTEVKLEDENLKEFISALLEAYYESYPNHKKRKQTPMWLIPERRQPSRLTKSKIINYYEIVPTESEDESPEENTPKDDNPKSEIEELEEEEEVQTETSKKRKLIDINCTEILSPNSPEISFESSPLDKPETSLEKSPLDSPETSLESSPLDSPDASPLFPELTECPSSEKSWISIFQSDLEDHCMDIPESEEWFQAMFY